MNTIEHVDDDYLICREYEEQMSLRSDKFPDFICFQHSNQKHYFAWVNEDQQIVMRGEGYSSADSRDRGIESVIQNRKNRDRYKLIESHGAFFLSLRAANHQEIGRSCPKNDEESLWSLVAAMFDFSGDGIPHELNTELSTDPLAPAYGPSPIIAHEQASELDSTKSSTSRTSGWWWILLVILFMVILLWWRSCSKPENSSNAAPKEQPSYSEPKTPQEAPPPAGDLEPEKDSVPAK